MIRENEKTENINQSGVKSVLVLPTRNPVQLSLAAEFWCISGVFICM